MSIRLGSRSAGEPGTMRKDAAQEHHRGEPGLESAAGPSSTRCVPTQLLFSAVFSENEELAFVNMLFGWKDAHAQSKL